MLFNGRALIFTFSGTQVKIAEIERLHSMVLAVLHSVSNEASSAVDPAFCRPNRLPILVFLERYG